MSGDHLLYFKTNLLFSWTPSLRTIAKLHSQWVSYNPFKSNYHSCVPSNNENMNPRTHKHNTLRHIRQNYFTASKVHPQHQFFQEVI